MTHEALSAAEPKMSRAVEATKSSARTLPVHSSGATSGSVVNVRTSSCASNFRASRAPGNAAYGSSIGCFGSLR